MKRAHSSSAAGWAGIRCRSPAQSSRARCGRRPTRAARASRASPAGSSSSRRSRAVSTARSTSTSPRSSPTLRLRPRRSRRARRPSSSARRCRRRPIRPPSSRCRSRLRARMPDGEIALDPLSGRLDDTNFEGRVITGPALRAREPRCDRLQPLPAARDEGRERSRGKAAARRRRSNRSSTELAQARPRRGTADRRGAHRRREGARCRHPRHAGRRGRAVSLAPANARGTPAALVRRARPARPALAGGSHAVPRLGLGSDAAADAGRDREAVLRALHRAIPGRRDARGCAAGRGDAPVVRARLLRAGAKPASRGR